MARDIGMCVLLVSPNGNYAEVLRKDGDKLTVLTGCGKVIETALAEFEKLGAKPVQASRWPHKQDDGCTYLVDGPSFMELDIYADGKRLELREKKR